jgi:hypothetical protein
LSEGRRPGDLGWLDFGAIVRKLFIFSVEYLGNENLENVEAEDLENVKVEDILDVEEENGNYLQFL